MSNRVEMQSLGDPLLNDDDGSATYGDLDERTRTCGEKFRSKIKIVIGLGEIATWDLWRSAIAELIAVVIFVFVGVGSVISTNIANTNAEGGTDVGGAVSSITVIALTHGFAIAVLASSIGHISGGHINPAVSFAMMLTGNISIVRGLVYMSLQIVAGALGAALLALCTPSEFRQDWQHDLHADVTPIQGFIIEIVLTFFLLFTIFANAVDQRGNSVMAPFFIGLAVATDHFMGRTILAYVCLRVWYYHLSHSSTLPFSPPFFLLLLFQAVPLTGASMNPARSFGPAFIHGDYLKNYYIYWFGPLVGATGAAFVYRLIFIHGDQAEKNFSSVTKKLESIERKLQ
eukprot:m.27036 g.27036  ORF g.27036 m.27036 type:complete len:344 (-) comp5906_c1_seq1:295-1326(-)